MCFYSAYEAATSFVIGQRISRRQSAVIKRSLADQLGDRPTIAGVPVAAFPRPSRLLELTQERGLNDEKVRRLHGLARAALDGRLDTEALRAMPAPEALAALRELPGVGPFTADAVLYRGCGVADGLPASDDLGRTGDPATSTAWRHRLPPMSSASPRRGGRTGCGPWSCCGSAGRARRVRTSAIGEADRGGAAARAWAAGRGGAARRYAAARAAAAR